MTFPFSTKHGRYLLAAGLLVVAMGLSVNAAAVSENATTSVPQQQASLPQDIGLVCTTVHEALGQRLVVKASEPGVEWKACTATCSFQRSDQREGSLTCDNELVPPGVSWRVCSALYTDAITVTGFSWECVNDT